jgi:5-methylcytosine-specific restriction protein B
VSYVLRFAFGINNGDYVIIKSGNYSILGIARIIGPITYSQHPLPLGHHQSRQVEWIKTFKGPELIKNINQFAQQAVQYLGVECSPDNITDIQRTDTEDDRNRINTILTAFGLLKETAMLLRNEEDNMSNTSLNQILYGPPGTGKTFITAEKAVDICSSGFTKNIEGDKKSKRKKIMEKYKDFVESERISFVTFHQSYGYEEFVEGLKPKLDKSSDESSDDETRKSGQVNYHIHGGVFKEICKRARENDKNENYVIIIDEINRGNISKIFGELITLIEDDKREGEVNHISVILPYSTDEFSVPKNLYIIGTMNTADRSLANVDTALRRRFHFEPMMPDPTALSGLRINGIDIQKLLEVINQRIEALYDREHTIGHAYFTELLDNTINEDANFKKLKSIFENKVIPLLEEYFFDDWQKIHLVLGDNKKPADYQFIKETETNYSELFGNNDLTDSYSTKSYQINKISFDKPQSYIGIYKVKNNEQ